MRIITGRARGLKLTTPKNWDVRPTADRVKESLFNIIGSKIIGAQVLDLFAGTGNLGLESWSRGAEKIVFTDTSKESLRLVESNIAKCRAQDDTETICGGGCIKRACVLILFLPTRLITRGWCRRLLPRWQKAHF